MKKDVTHNPLLRLSDFPLVVTLSLDFPIEGVEPDPNDPRRANFLFEQSSKLEAAIKQYYGSKTRIEPQQFFNQIRAVKARLYS